MARRNKGNGRARGLDGRGASGDEEAVQPANAGHNIASRAAILQECARGFRDIRAKRAALNEEGGEIRKRLRDAGLNVEGLMFALAVEAREQDDRDVYLDAVRESFAALGIGEQGSLFVDDPASDQAPAKDDGEDGDDDPRPSFLKTREAEKTGGGDRDA